MTVEIQTGSDEAGSQRSAVPIDVGGASAAMGRFDVTLHLAWLAGVVLMACHGAGLWSLAQMRSWVDAVAAGANVEPLPPTYDLLANVSLYGGIVAWLACFTAFFAAMYQARRLATAVGVRDYSHSFLWTVITLFIPFLNLYRPWVGLDEIRRSVIGTAQTERPSADGDMTAFTYALAATIIVGGVGARWTSRLADNLEKTVGAISGPTELSVYLSKFVDFAMMEAAIAAAMVSVPVLYLATLRPHAVRLARQAHASTHG